MVLNVLIVAVVRQALNDSDCTVFRKTHWTPHFEHLAPACVSVFRCHRRARHVNGQRLFYFPPARATSFELSSNAAMLVSSSDSPCLRSRFCVSITRRKSFG